MPYIFLLLYSLSYHTCLKYVQFYHIFFRLVKPNLVTVKLKYFGWLSQPPKHLIVFRNISITFSFQTYALPPLHFIWLQNNRLSKDKCGKNFSMIFCYIKIAAFDYALGLVSINRCMECLNLEQSKLCSDFVHLFIFTL